MFSYLIIRNSISNKNFLSLLLTCLTFIRSTMCYFITKWSTKYVIKKVFQSTNSESDTNKQENNKLSTKKVYRWVQVTVPHGGRGRTFFFQTGIR